MQETGGVEWGVLLLDKLNNDNRLAATTVTYNYWIKGWKKDIIYQRLGYLDDRGGGPSTVCSFDWVRIDW